MTWKQTVIIYVFQSWSVCGSCDLAVRRKDGSRKTNNAKVICVLYCDVNLFYIQLCWSRKMCQESKMCSLPNQSERIVDKIMNTNERIGYYKILNATG